MPLQNVAKLAFQLLAVAVAFLALVPGPIGHVVASDVQRHYLAFLILPIVAYIGWPKIGVVRLWLLFAAFGGTIELLQQWMAVGREGQWKDWINDLIATALALGLVTAIIKLTAMRRRTES